MGDFQRILQLQDPYMTGEDIRSLQRKIGATPDGIFGPNTQNLVRLAQRLAGLETTGVVDKNTWDSIRDDLKKQNGSLVFQSGNKTIEKVVQVAKIGLPVSLILLLILIGVRSGKED